MKPDDSGRMPAAGHNVGYVCSLIREPSAEKDKEREKALERDAAGQRESFCGDYTIYVLGRKIFADDEGWG